MGTSASGGQRRTLVEVCAVVAFRWSGSGSLRIICVWLEFLKACRSRESIERHNSCVNVVRHKTSRIKEYSTQLFMTNFRPLLVIFTVVVSCHMTPKKDVISILGRVKNIPATKVYLAEAHRWYQFLDSANYN